MTFACVAALGWGLLLADELVRDYWGPEWEVNGASIGGMFAVATALALASFFAWRAAVRRRA